MVTIKITDVGPLPHRQVKEYQLTHRLYLDGGKVGAQVWAHVTSSITYWQAKASHAELDIALLQTRLKELRSQLAAEKAKTPAPAPDPVVVSVWQPIFIGAVTAMIIIGGWSMYNA